MKNKMITISKHEKLEVCVCGHAISKHEKYYNDCFEDYLYESCRVKNCDCEEFGDEE